MTWNLPRIALFATCLALASRALVGAVSVENWHGYTQSNSTTPHFAFTVADYKRGLFFGSCGPSTRSLQWEYSIDLSGTGSEFTPEMITIQGSDLKMVKLAAGRIRTDSNRRWVTIDLKVDQAGTVVPFPGNGCYRIHGSG